MTMLTSVFTENCPAPANASGWEIVKEIRRAAQAYGSIKVFRAYLELPEHASSPESRSYQLRSELQASGVSLTDCPHNGRKDVADKMILVDMMAHAIDNPAPWTYVLISGDRDFAYAISVLGLRQYQVVLVSPSSAHISLKSQATTCVDWNDILGKLSTGSARKPYQNQESLPVPRPTIGSFSSTSTSVSRVPRTLESPFRGRTLSLSDDGHKSISEDIDLINYLKACRRRRQPSISSEDSRSVMSNSHESTMHTAYFSAQEVPVFSPPPLPHPRIGSIPNPNIIHAVDPADSEGSFPKPTPTPAHEPSGSKPPADGHAEAPRIHANYRPEPATPVQQPTSTVPKIFLPLIDLLKEHLAKGSRYPSREDLSRVLDQKTHVYSTAKVERFGQYIALAEKHRIVTQGPAGIALRPEWLQ
ncbi:hypothetical protein AN958_02368 [Leucoagaricus sp. SymC.cos]|nr:hypothetical protein AN958_02368 [Leucoagaricus sp. SymC.cos]